MFKTVASLAVIVAAIVIGVPASAKAAPVLRPFLAAADNAPVVQLTRATRARALKLSTTQSAGPCGVWRCTWPTSNGGCLVWEKTRCKVINPF